jgi:mRNA-degrading endonuclease RelE of RelBE toxin-antitoxin system
VGPARLSEKPGRTVQEVPRFYKAKRRLPESVQDIVDEQVRGLLDNPHLGEPKIGALKGVRVVKFKVGPHQYLLAYQFFPKSNVIEMLDVAVHENFYKGLEKYLKSK